MNRKTQTLALVAILAVTGLFTIAPVRAAQADGYHALVTHYEEIRLALLNDTLDGVAAEAAALAEGARALAADFDAAKAGVPAEAAEEAEALLPKLATAGKAVAAAQDLEAARAAFGDLTEPMLRYRELAGDTDVKVVYCPMAGKAWLQKDGETIGNPYYGQSMAECGTFQEN